MVMVHYVARARTDPKKVWTDCSSPASYSDKSARFRTPPGVFGPLSSWPFWLVRFRSLVLALLADGSQVVAFELWSVGSVRVAQKIA